MNGGELHNLYPACYTVAKTAVITARSLNLPMPSRLYNLRGLGFVNKIAFCGIYKAKPL